MYGYGWYGYGAYGYGGYGYGYGDYGSYGIYSGGWNYGYGFYGGDTYSNYDYVRIADTTTTSADATFVNTWAATTTVEPITVTAHRDDSGTIIPDYIVFNDATEGAIGEAHTEAESSTSTQIANMLSSVAGVLDWLKGTPGLSERQSAAIESVETAFETASTLIKGGTATNSAEVQEAFADAFKSALGALNGYPNEMGIAFAMMSTATSVESGPIAPVVGALGYIAGYAAGQYLTTPLINDISNYAASMIVNYAL